MPYHTNTKKKQIDIVKENKALKEPAISGLSPKMSKKVREHAKLYPRGMQSSHMRIMIKHLRAKKTFKQAHELALKEEKKSM